MPRAPREHETVGDGTLALWLPSLDAGIARQDADEGEWMSRTFARPRLDRGGAHA